MIITQDSLQQTLQSLFGTTLLSVDTETTGVELTDKPFAFILADELHTYYFDERVIPGLWENLFVREFFIRPYVEWIFQNAKFDMRMLKRRGITLRGIISDDTIAARIRRNDHFGAKPYSLDSQARRHGMVKLDLAKKYIAEHNLYETRATRLGELYKVPRYDWVPIDVMAEYAIHDARITYDLYKIYTKDFDEKDWTLFRNEQALTHVCFEMEEHGLYTSQEYVRLALEFEQRNLREQLNNFAVTTGKEYVNSAKSLCPLFEAEGETIHRTAKGNLSLTDDILETYTSPTARMVQTIRFYEKRISTYYESYVNMADDGGVLHAEMWPGGTRTGRFSYSNPNLQNIPKEEKSTDQYVVRGCFVPRPGKVYVSFDYSQMEYRMMLAYANQRNLIHEVMNGKDIHQATADLLGIERSPAKTLNFAILYGAGVDKIASMLNCTTQEAMRLKIKYYMGLPRVETFVDSVISTGKSRGYVVNWFGRKLYSDREHAYALPNHLIQSGGADVVKIAMNRIRESIPDVPMVLQVHDQLVFEMTPDDYHVIPKIKEIMENVWPEMNGMKLIVDVSWSDVSLAERDMKEWLT